MNRVVTPGSGRRGHDYLQRHARQFIPSADSQPRDSNIAGRSVNRGLFHVHLPIQGTQQLLLSHVRVLCVENHPGYMGTLRYKLETAGYEVIVATNRNQTLRLLTTLDVDGVVRWCW